MVLTRQSCHPRHFPLAGPTFESIDGIKSSISFSNRIKPPLYSKPPLLIKTPLMIKPLLHIKLPLLIKPPLLCLNIWQPH